nr:phage head closure protein [Propylenella binzhouense]
MSAAGATHAGRLRHRMILERATRTPDGAGGEALAWSEAARFFAAIVPVRAEERVAGEGPGDRVTHRIAIRHRSGIAAGDRLRLGARLFTIRTIHDPQEDGRFLVCLATEDGGLS